MFEDTYSQPEAPDPVLEDAQVLELVRRHVPEAQTVTGIDESGGEARTYVVDHSMILKVQRPQQLRPRTSLEKEVFFLKQLEGVPGVSVPRVLGYGREGRYIEFNVQTRMAGTAMRHVPLDEDARGKVLTELGKTLRRIHELPQEPLLASGLFPTDESFAVVRARFEAYLDSMVQRIREHGRPWSLELSPEQVTERALAALPPSEERVALHSNPGPEHTFVVPETGTYSGLIDFGDAFISHPALDLRRRAGPRDRDAIMRGYTAEAPVSESFLATWQVVHVLSDLIDIAYYPDRAASAERDLQDQAGRLAA
jgi:aminoglycoside phosphotransferase (APT) family kinase protein